MEANVQELGVMQTLIEHGGAAVWLIFASGFFLVGFGIERIIALFFKLNFNTQQTLDAIRTKILEKRYTDALQICNSQPKAPEISVIKAGLMAVENGREAMRSALSGAVLEVSHKTEVRLPYISLIANVATLLGLLGTIAGLIKLFAVIGNLDPATKAQKMGIGISEAMYATATGLTVGIVAMVCHTVCVSKADEIVGNAQDAGFKLVTWVEQSERSEKNG